jgi:hypothetical protein
MNLYRVWCRFEPDHINLATGRRGQWRVTDCYEINIQGLQFHDSVGRELAMLSTKPYPRGCIIRPHKELNRVLALRRSLDGIDVIAPLAGSHPAAAVLRSDQALTFQPLDGIGVDRTVDAEMDDQQGIAPGLGHEDIFKHDFTTAGEVVSSESLHFEVKG